MRDDLLEAYRQDLRLRNLATVQGHVLVASGWLAWCTEQGIDPLAVSREDLRAYLASRRAAGNKTTTLQKTFSGLSVFYEFLEDAELYSGSAMRDIRNIKKTYLSPYKSDAETRQLITIEQAAEIIRRTIKTRDRAILATLFFTGVRARGTGSHGLR